MKLKIAADLVLPPDAVTQAIAIVAKRRVGKSYTARRFAEQLFKAGQQLVIVDPKGDWWGIRSSADGKSPGLPVVILGGERGDVPLEVGSGEVVAKLVTEERVSVLLDLSLFRKHEVSTFMTAFLENLYRLKAREVNRTPVMLLVDEADAIAPQKPQENQARMLGAAEDIVRRGGQRGIGCILITQRSAVLNKNVLTQVEMIVALRTIAPQDLKALDAWVEVHGEKEQRDTLMASLPSLPVGDAWFWSPGWPTAEGIFKRAHVLPIETFDSGATPKSGERRVEPKNLADVDLDSLTRQMAATIERAKAEDPKELKRQIAERDRKIRDLEKAPTATRAAEKAVVDQAAIDRAVRQATAKLQKALEAAMKFIINISTQSFDVAGVDKEELERAVGAAVNKAVGLVDQRLEARARHMERLRSDAQRISTTLKEALGEQDVEVNVNVSKNEPFTVAPVRATARKPPRQPSDYSPNGEVSPGEQRILDALAELRAFGIDPATRSQAGVMSAYNLTGGTGSTHIGRLVQAGLVWIPTVGNLSLTDEGERIAAAPSGALTLEELHERALSKLGPGERRILEYLLSIYPKAQSRADVGVEVGYNLTGGTGSTHVGKLVNLGFADIPKTGQLSAGRLLHPEELG